MSQYPSSIADPSPECSANLDGSPAKAASPIAVLPPRPSLCVTSERPRIAFSPLSSVFSFSLHSPASVLAVVSIYMSIVTIVVVAAVAVTLLRAMRTSTRLRSPFPVSHAPCRSVPRDVLLLSCELPEFFLSHCSEERGRELSAATLLSLLFLPTSSFPTLAAANAAPCLDPHFSSLLSLKRASFRCIMNVNWS